jgi:hypothetical protein
VRQFVSHHERVKDLQGDELLWGDEIEYGIFQVDHEKREIRLSLRAKEVSSVNYCQLLSTSFWREFNYSLFVLHVHVLTSLS